MTKDKNNIKKINKIKIYNKQYKLNMNMVNRTQ